MEEDIFTRLEKHNIFNADPGTTIKISHLKDDTQEELNKIFDQYSSAFARDAFDCGEYTGLLVHLDVLEGKSAYQKERNMKSSDKLLIKPIIEQSLAAGIFEQNSGNYMANLNCVSKPSSELHEFITSNKLRICIDLRSLNETPKVRMPRTDLLKERAYGSYLSSFDLTMFFYGIKLAPERKNIPIYCGATPAYLWA